MSSSFWIPTTRDSHEPSPLSVGFDSVSKVGAHLLFRQSVVTFKEAPQLLRIQSSRGYLAYDLSAPAGQRDAG